MNYNILIFLLFFINSSIAQQLHYFGFDTTRSYWPTDIIETKDNGLFIVNVVNSSAPMYHNFNNHHYLLKLNSNTDTLWTDFYENTFTDNVIAFQQVDSTYTLLGNTEGSYICGSLGTTIPNSNYFVKKLSGTGDSISYTSYSEKCVNAIQNIYKDINHTYVHFRFKDGGNVSSKIRKVNFDGTFTSSTQEIPSWLINLDDFIVHNNGYLFARLNQLSKIDEDGNLLWEKSINAYPQVMDFCKTEKDSLILLLASSDGSSPDSSIIVKMDTLGNETWRISLSIKGKHIFKHSSGSYIVSGNNNDSLVVVSVSADGNILWREVIEAYSRVFVTKSIELSDASIVTIGHVGMFGEFGQLFLFKINPISTSIDINNEVMKFQIYPNPNNGRFICNVNEPRNTPIHYEIQNLFGQKIAGGNITELHQEFNFSDFAKGIYFINVSNGNYKLTKRFLYW